MALKYKYPGLIKEKMSSGRYRTLVRVKGNVNKKIRIPCDLEGDDFIKAYTAARRGEQPPIEIKQPKWTRLVQEELFKADAERILTRTRQRAKANGIEFDLSYADFVNLFQRQKGKCALSGLAFKIRQSPRAGRKKPFTMSIDRIDNAKGYLPNNVQITCLIANLAKLNWSEKDFIRMCRGVITKQSCPPSFEIAGQHDKKVLKKQ